MKLNAVEAESSKNDTTVLERHFLTITTECDRTKQPCAIQSCLSTSVQKQRLIWEVKSPRRLLVRLTKPNATTLREYLMLRIQAYSMQFYCGDSFEVHRHRSRHCERAGAVLFNNGL